MAETPQINHLPEDEPGALPVEAPKVETPVIQSQDLEHQPEPATRMSNKGVKITPRHDPEDTRDFAREDEDALRAMEELEKQYRERLPG